MIDEQERIAIIAEGCKISQAEAEAIYQRSKASTEFAEQAVQRIKDSKRNAKLRALEKKSLSGKDKAAGL